VSCATIAIGAGPKSAAVKLKPCAPTPPKAPNGTV
jgi:hypothetical protein